MGKLTWDDLRLIYEGQFGVTANEASDIIAKELFSKKWVGTPDKIGRMWEDVENCISFSEFLIEVDKFKKKKNYTQTAAIEAMHEEKHAAVKKFSKETRTFVFKHGSERFRNLVIQWQKQLREAGFLKQKPISAFKEKRLMDAAKRMDKKLSKQGMVIKRSTKK